MESEALPQGWKRTTLGAVADFVNGDRGENYPTQADRIGAGVPFINTGHIEANGRLTSAGMDYITRDSFDRLRSGKVKPGDIVYCLRGSTIGKTARNHYIEGAIASSLVMVRAKAGSCQEYLYFYLTSPLGQQLVAQHDNGSAQPNLSVRALSSYPLSLPPFDEQRSIAHILGTLDDKIELNRRMNETLEAIAQALFKSWFVDFDGARTAPVGGEFEIPVGWRVGSILEYADLLSGGTPKTDRSEYWGGDIGWASAKDVSQCSETFLLDTERTITRKGLEESATQLIPQNATVVVARGATTGRMVMFGRTMAMNQTCYAIVSKTGTPFALHYHLREGIQALVHAAHGSVFNTITTDTFRSARFVLPPIDVMRAFDQRVARLMSRVAGNSQGTRTLAALRDALLPKLISGELRVNDAERFVGPAS